MTATIIQPVEDVTLRLEALLGRARQLKQSDSIHPPLPASEFAGDLGLPPTDVSRRAHHPSVEIAAKRLLQSQLATIDINSSEFGQIWNLLDIVQIIGEQDQCEPVLLWYLIEDLLDSQSIEGCRPIFDYLESRRERLVAKNFSKVSLVILRACNELLRRLSRAEDAVFCGRVFIFVFQCFPLGDRSSVNRHGDYNSENVTTFDELPPKEQLQSTGEDTVMTDVVSSNETKQNAGETNEISEQASTSIIKDMDELYPVFWGLQKSFAYPPSVWDTTILDSFKKAFESTIEKFKEMRNVLSTTNSEQRRGTKRKSEELEMEEFSNSFNPKYLTSRELFELELSDLAFRRHILVQALILIQFLLSFTEKAKKKMASRTQQKTAFTLSEEDTKWAIETRKSISNALRVGHDGPAFARVVDTVLSRDKNWVRWKEENCPEISRPAVTPDAFSEATEGARATWMWKRLRATPLGSLDLRFLSENEHNGGVDRLSLSERFLVPKAETLVKKVTEIDLDLDFAATDEEKQALEESKAGQIWRALRITSKTKLNQFEKLEDGGSLNILIEEQDEAQDTKAEEIQDTEGASYGSSATNAIDSMEISPRLEANPPAPVEA